MKRKTRNTGIFSWEGINNLGKRIKGDSLALNHESLQKELQLSGIKLVKARRKKSFRGNKKVKSKDIALFCQHLSHLLNAKVNLLQALEILSRGQHNTAFKIILDKIRNNLALGNYFYESLIQHPKCFSAIFINLIKIGEKSGTLEQIINILAVYTQKFEHLKNRIIKLMYYPIFILITSVTILIALLIFVVPQFESLFKSFGGELPKFTQYIVLLSRNFSIYWLHIFFAVATVIGSTIFLLRFSPKFRNTIDSMLIRLPFIGKLIKKVILVRTTITLSTSLSAGVSMVECLTLASTVANNFVFKNALLKIKEGISSGHSLHSMVHSHKVFPELVVQMISVGEESGNIPGVLKNISLFYEDDLETSINSMITLIEPIIILILAIIIGSFVLALYLPIFKLGSII